MAQQAEPPGSPASHATPGPAHLVLLGAVARRFYLEGRSKIEIADELRISRFRVARLLEEARSTGLVRIEIGHQDGIDGPLSDQLVERLGLRSAVVLDTAEREVATLREALGRVAGRLLSETVAVGDVLGLAWARSVAALVPSVSRMAAVPLVQLTGSLQRDDIGMTSIEIVREVARRTGGPAVVFYAPFILPDTETARTLREHPDIARAVALYPRVTKAVVGLGTWAPGQSTLYDAMSEAHRRELADQGVVADVSGVFLDAEGRVVAREHTARMITMDAEQLGHVAQTGEVLAIPYGRDKVGAVRAAVRSGLVTSLVTHTEIARALLD